MIMLVGLKRCPGMLLIKFTFFPSLESPFMKEKNANCSTSIWWTSTTFMPTSAGFFQCAFAPQSNSSRMNDSIKRWSDDKRMMFEREEILQRVRRKGKKWGQFISLKGNIFEWKILSNSFCWCYCVKKDIDSLKFEIFLDWLQGFTFALQFLRYLHVYIQSWDLGNRKLAIAKQIFFIWL